jgi:catechol 2,3-dioxygenase-like lactoylglutathione lyase family enzyme
VFDHVTIRVSDRASSERFYLRVLSELGIEPSAQSESFTEWKDFSLAPADSEHPATRHLHLGFVAPSREHVDAFWRAGVDAGYESDGEPGLRPEYADDYYGAFLLDPDGNSAEAVHHGSLREGGVVDHLWIRVSDLAESTRFYETVRPAAGFRATEGRSSPASAARSRSSRAARRPSTRTSPLSPRTTRPSTASTRRRRRPATATTARPASGSSTTGVTTAHSCSTPTATTSRRSPTRASSR